MIKDRPDGTDVWGVRNMGDRLGGEGRCCPRRLPALARGGDGAEG